MDDRAQINPPTTSVMVGDRPFLSIETAYEVVAPPLNGCQRIPGTSLLPRQDLVGRLRLPPRPNPDHAMRRMPAAVPEPFGYLLLGTIRDPQLDRFFLSRPAVRETTLGDYRAARAH